MYSHSNKMLKADSSLMDRHYFLPYHNFFSVNLKYLYGSEYVCFLLRNYSDILGQVFQRKDKIVNNEEKIFLG